MKLVVQYSLEKDVNNIRKSVFKFRYRKYGRENMQKILFKHLPRQAQKEISGIKSEKEFIRKITQVLRENQKQNPIIFKQKADDLEKLWKKTGDKIINKLEKIYQKPFPFEKITVNLGSIPICPYNFKKRWIMVYANTPSSSQLEIIEHELNHFMFYFYHNDLKDNIGIEKFESLKESLTVFTDSSKKKGYPDHQKLRNWLSKQEPNIPRILKDGKWKKYLPLILLATITS